ncbi:hypothetical protein BCR44DRAFT_1271615 [Catenaria anguillulae PL171]|uniref:Uncharacterized protein n=1 Tax=Catenaria anguillulae PL171 TaxID=765915 RepID=A0A1Y2HBU5_9FUNG|nr:hypothetical protein BCR44DRAFT_1271615 [Catenaria anguillulae PL171]
MYRPPFLASSSSASSPAGASAHPRAHSPSLYPPPAPSRGPGSTLNRLQSHASGYSHPAAAAAASSQHRPTPLATPGAHPAAVAARHAATAAAGSGPVMPKLKIHLTLAPPPLPSSSSSIEIDSQHQPRPSSSTNTQPLAMPMPMPMPVAVPAVPDSPTLSALSDLSSLYQDDQHDDGDDDEYDDELVDRDRPESSRRSANAKRVTRSGGRHKRKHRHMDADADDVETVTVTPCDGETSYSLTAEDHTLGLGYSRGTLKPFVCRGCSRRWKHRSGFTAHLETGCPRPFSAAKKRKSVPSVPSASSSSSSPKPVVPTSSAMMRSAASSSFGDGAPFATSRSASAASSNRPSLSQPPPPLLPPPPPPRAVAALSRSLPSMPTPPLTPLESPMVPTASGRNHPATHTTAAALLCKPDQPLSVAPAASKPPARRGRPRIHPVNLQSMHPAPPPTPVHCPCGQAHPPAFTGTAPRPYTPPPVCAPASHPHTQAALVAPPARPPTSTTPLAGPATNPDARVPMAMWPKCTLCPALGHPSCVAAHVMASGHTAWFCMRCEVARLATAKPSRRVPRSAIMAPLIGAGGRILPVRRPVGAAREDFVLPSLARQVGTAHVNADGVYVVGGWMADRTAVRFPSVKMEGGGGQSASGLMVASGKPVARRQTRVVVVAMRKGNDAEKPSVDQVAKEATDDLYRKLAERRPVSPPMHPATPKLVGSNRPSALVLDHSTHAQQQQQPLAPSSSVRTLTSSATSALVKEDFIVPWRSSPVCLSPVLPEPLQTTPRRAAAAVSSTSSYMTTTTPLRGSAVPAWPASPSTILGSVHRNGGSSAAPSDFDDLLGGLTTGRSPASPLLPFPLGSMLGGLATLDGFDVLSSPSPKVTLGNAQRSSGSGSPLKGKVKRNADEAENRSAASQHQQHHQQRTPPPVSPASPVMSSLDKELARHVPAYRLPPSKRIRSMPALHFNKNKARRGSSAAAKSGLPSTNSKGLCPSSSSSSFGGIPPTTSPDLPPDWPASKLLCSPPPLTIAPSLAAAAGLLVASTPRQPTNNPVGWAGLIHLPSPMPTPCGDSLSAPIDITMRGANATDLMMLMSPLASPTQMAFSSPLASNAGSMYAHQPGLPPPAPQQQQQPNKVEHGRYGTSTPSVGPYSSLAPARAGMGVWSASSPAPQAAEEEAGMAWDDSFDDMVSLEPMDV